MTDLRDVALYLVSVTADSSGGVVTMPTLLVEDALAYVGTPRSRLWVGGPGIAMEYDVGVCFPNVPQNKDVWQFVLHSANPPSLWVLVLDERSPYYLGAFRCLEIRHAETDIRSRTFHSTLLCQALSSEDRVEVDVDKKELVGRP